MARSFGFGALWIPMGIAAVVSGCMSSSPVEPIGEEGTLVDGLVEFRDTCPTLPSGCGGDLGGTRWEYGSVCFSIDDFLPVSRQRCPDAFFNQEQSLGAVEGSIDFSEGAMSRDVRLTMQAEVVYSEECVPNRARCEETMAGFLEGRFGVTPSCNYLPYRTGEMYCVCRLPQTTYEALDEARPMSMGLSGSVFEVEEEGEGRRYGYCAASGRGLQLSVPAFMGMQVGGYHSLVPAR